MKEVGEGGNRLNNIKTCKLFVIEQLWFLKQEYFNPKPREQLQNYDITQTLKAAITQAVPTEYFTSGSFKITYFYYVIASMIMLCSFYT